MTKHKPHQPDDIALPQQLEAEKAVLGTLMLDSTFMATAHRMGLHSWDFGQDSHQHIYAAIVHMGTQPDCYDPIQIADHLRTDGTLERCGGLAYISSLYTDLPRFAKDGPFQGRVQLILDASHRRRVMREANALMNTAADGEVPVIELATRMQRVGTELGTRAEDSMQPVAHLVDEFMRKYAERTTNPQQGLMTGINLLDELLGGLMPGHLCVLAARTGQGKTTAALQITNELLDQIAHTLVYYSFEVSAEDAIERLVTLTAGVEDSARRAGVVPDPKRFKGVTDFLRTSRLAIVDNLPAQFTALSADAHIRHQQSGLSCIVVDYIGLLSFDGRRVDNRVQEMSAITRGLKLLARDLKLPVIALAQLNREFDHRGPSKSGHLPVPRLSDLRESGSIEQDADQVIFLVRDPDSETTHPTNAILALEKNRHGRKGHVRCTFDPLLGRFQW